VDCTTRLQRIRGKLDAEFDAKVVAM